MFMFMSSELCVAAGSTRSASSPGLRRLKAICRRLAHVLTVAVGVILFGNQLRAQEIGAVPLGSRIRLSGDLWPHQITGNLIGADSGIVVLRRCSSCNAETYRLGQIQAIAVSQGRSVSRKRLLVGLSAGVATGAAFGLWHGRRTDRDCPSNGAFCGAATVFEPIGGALIGGLIGMVPAFALPIERWRTIWRLH